jgi:hypothetical protein
MEHEARDRVRQNLEALANAKAGASARVIDEAEDGNV